MNTEQSEKNAHSDLCRMVRKYLERYDAPLSFFEPVDVTEQWIDGRVPVQELLIARNRAFAKAARTKTRLDHLLASLAAWATIPPMGSSETSETIFGLIVDALLYVDRE